MPTSQFPFELVSNGGGTPCGSAFGLWSAHRVFNKLLKPGVAQLGKMGIRLIIYLDEILIKSETKELAQIHIAITVNLLSSLGFVINEDKSLYEPTQELEFLGFLVNSVTMSLYLPKDKSVDPEGLPKTHRQPYVVSKSFVSSSGKAFILNSSGIPSPPPLSLLNESQKCSTKENPELRRIHAISRPRCSTAASLVEGSPCSL